MLKKNKFNIKFSKLVLPITKRIESFFNLLDYFNKNKKKYLNSWQKSVDKKIFFSLISTVIIVIGYFLLPAFYDQAKIKDQLKDQILQEYNFEVQLDENFEYGLFPRPHFFIKDLKIKNDSKFSLFNTLILGMKPFGPGNFQYVFQPLGNVMLIAPLIKSSLNKL